MTTEVLGSGAVEPLPEHAKLGPYRLVQQLGEGGMGVVHLGLDKSGRAVAIKVLRAHIAHDPMARARLAREVETLSRIDDPGVAPFLDADIDGERPYLVTRYVPGPSLDDVVDSDGPLHGPDLRRLGQGLAQSLEAIHAADVIHRDLKPGNVLLLDGEPVLIDFGIAHIAHDVRLTSTGLVMGTPGYLAPEVVEGSAVTPATDWWGWAATVAFGASGRPPFGRGPMDVVLARVTRGEADLTGVDPLLAPLLAAALTPDPDARPDVREVLAALDGYAAGRPTTQVLSRHPERGLTAVLPVQVPVTDVFGSRPTTVAPTLAPAGYPVAAAPPLPAAQPRAQDQAAAAAYGPVRPGAPVAADGSPEVAHTDPRIGLANRSGVLAALVAVVTAAAAVVPMATLIALLALTVLARAADRSVTHLVVRRHASGVRRSDVPVAVVTGPWHVLLAVVASAIAAVVPFLVGISTTFCAGLAVASVNGGSPRPAMAVPLAAGALFAVLMAWWGPGGASLRRGTRSLVRGVTGPAALRQSLVAVLLLGAGALVVVAVVRSGVPAWWPFSGAPGGTLWGLDPGS